MVHGRKDGTAHRNFKANRNRFIEGVDFFRRNSSEAKKEFGVTAPNGLILITESGFLMLAKSFADDLAWTVQRELVNNYFCKKEVLPTVKESASNSVPLGWIAGKPKHVNVDDCIVALEVLRLIKHSDIRWKQECEHDDSTDRMVDFYEKEIAAIDRAIQCVGMQLTSCSANKRFI